MVGVNSRLDEIRRRFLRVKLPRLEANNLRRRQIADAYDGALAESGVSPPWRRPDCQHVFHQYVVSVGDRDAAQRALAEQGVSTAIHYPFPVHLHPAYAGRIHVAKSRCVAAELAARQVLSLPMYPELSDAQVEQVCAALRKL